ncbi:hypothetical protein EFS38_07780 [Dickeya undicola]|uniref:Pentatricopeptide repeat-containing protein n=1 Tax=Dickeya undicola TaxID=1577887 RepID=A0ABX9WUT7_9GAMM|nr:hypothetical protein [Dickeya undicola]RNM24739.1 hypothetical protein EFS38_07780 [Dickeya undicola]
MFTNPYDSQKYSENVHQAVNNLLMAFKGGDTRLALDVLDWMKEAVITESSVVGVDTGASLNASSPTFPLKFINVK